MTWRDRLYHAERRPGGLSGGRRKIIGQNPAWGAAYVSPLYGCDLSGSMWDMWDKLPKRDRRSHDHDTAAHLR